jgi:hypothetical protein
MGEYQNAIDEKKPFPAAFFTDVAVSKHLPLPNVKRRLSN